MWGWMAGLLAFALLVAAAGLYTRRELARMPPEERRARAWELKERLWRELRARGPDL